MRLSGNNIRQWEIMRSMYFMTGMTFRQRAKIMSARGESEEMFEYLICAICPVSGDYEPGEPECGFLFPAFMDGAAALNYVDVYQKDQAHPHTELLKMLGVW